MHPTLPMKSYSRKESNHFHRFRDELKEAQERINILTLENVKLKMSGCKLLGESLVSSNDLNRHGRKTLSF
jgi:hypothetical protein